MQVNVASLPSSTVTSGGPDIIPTGTAGERKMWVKIANTLF